MNYRLDFSARKPKSHARKTQGYFYQTWQANILLFCLIFCKNWRIILYQLERYNNICLRFSFYNKSFLEICLLYMSTLCKLHLLLISFNYILMLLSWYLSKITYTHTQGVPEYLGLLFLYADRVDWTESKSPLQLFNFHNN